MNFGKQARGWFWLTTTAIIGGIVSAGPGATTASAQTPPAASGAPATVTVSIPAGPLENAILSFGRQANLRMVYPSAITRGRSTVGVKGTLSVSAAVSGLLAGSGLNYALAGGNTVRIFDPASQTAESGGSAAAGSTLLAPITVQGTGLEGARASSRAMAMSANPAAPPPRPIRRLPKPPSRSPPSAASSLTT